MDTTTPICPILSTRDGIMELCVEDKCAWYVAPVKKCALYVLGHKGAVELQHLSK